MKLHRTAVCGLFAAVAWIGCPPAGFAEDRALVIGIGNYKIPEAFLPGIDKDVAMARDTLRRLGFKDSQIKVLEDGDATAAGIERAFRTWLIEGVAPGERAVFYFSGHGSQIPDRNGDEPDGLDEILVPYDFEPTAGDPRNVIVDDTLGEWLTHLRTSRTYLFIDACNSGSVTRAWGSAEKFLPYSGMPARPKAALRQPGKRGFIDASGAKGLNYLVVTAADDTESAQATDVGSLFTQGLVKAVREAVDGARPVTMALIKDVSTAVVRQLARSKPHQPQLGGDLARAGEDLRGASTTTTPPPAPPRPVWDLLEGAADNVPADHRLAVTVNQQEFQVGQLLRFELTAEADGYLNVLNVGEGEEEPVVLFPNRFHPENRVTKGERVSIPTGAFKLPAQLPQGMSQQRTLIVVLLTQTDLNGFKAGRPTEALRSLPASTARSFTVEAAREEAYHAGKAIVVIRK